MNRDASAGFYFDVCTARWSGSGTPFALIWHRASTCVGRNFIIVNEINNTPMRILKYYDAYSAVQAIKVVIQV